MEAKVTYSTNLRNVNWQEMKTTLQEDNFDNGRSPEQLKISFENSYAAVIAFSGDMIIGTARVLSDGVCNAYIVDVWTLSAYRKQGIASKMMKILLGQLPGQHVYLFTDDAEEFYEKLGFEKQAIGMGLVVGDWLNNAS